MIEIIKLAGIFLAITSLIVLMSEFIYSFALRRLLELPDIIDDVFIKFYGVIWILFITFFISLIIALKFALINLILMIIYAVLTYISVRCLWKEKYSFFKDRMPEQIVRNNKRRFYSKLRSLIYLFLFLEISLAWYGILEYKNELEFFTNFILNIQISPFSKEAIISSELYFVFMLYLYTLYIFGNFHGCEIIYSYEKYQISLKCNNETKTIKGYLMGKNKEFFIIKKTEDLDSGIIYIKKDLIESIKLLNLE